jgi:hypothetical protein
MTKNSTAKEGLPAPTKGERQEFLLGREDDEVGITRRAEREVIGLETRVEALTEDWEE